MQEQNNIKKAWTKTIIATMVFVVSQATIGATLIVVQKLCFGTPDASDAETQLLSPEMLALGILISGIITLGILTAMKMIRWTEVFRTERIDWRTTLYSIVGAATGIFAISYGMEVMEVPDSMKAEFTGMSTSLFCVINIALLGPVTEELVFRESIEGNMLRHGIKPWVSIVTSAIIFGAVHFNWIQTIGGACIGIILAVVYYKTNSLVLPCIIHIINNSVSVAQMAIYGDDEPSAAELLGGTGTAATVTIVCLAVCLWTLQLLWRHENKENERYKIIMSALQDKQSKQITISTHYNRIKKKMKHFFKNVLSTVVGIFVAGALLSLLGLFSLVGLATISSTPTQVSNNSVLMIELKGSIQERSQDNPLSALIDNDAMQTSGLDDIMTAIRMAKNEDKVKGIYIKAGTFTGAMPATLKAIRRALIDFKKSGKFVVAYGDIYTQGTYYLCSAADSVLVNPQGMIDWCGLHSQVMYYKDLLDKVGIGMQVVKVGTYKSAVEPYLLNEMSEANREQITTYSSDIWHDMLSDVAKSRKMTAEKLNTLADSSMLMRGTDVYKKAQLVDKLAYADEVEGTIKAMMRKKNNDEDYHIVKVGDMVQTASSTPKGLSGKAVAVYYAVGNIVNEPSSSFASADEIAGSEVIKQLRELADDDEIKAVVLRVNSGGGSAYASEQIWHEVMNIKAKKPIVVSMGDLAASGGYYISCAADYIYAEPTTLTGSIGIFGMFPNAGELLNNKLGIHFNTVKTNRHSDFGDYSRAFTPDERAMAQAYINNGYDLFTRRCADGRKMSQSAIKAIGEGRVWTGVRAKQLGLVDELGGLDAAIERAKQLAKIDEATVMEYPAKESTVESIMKSLSESSVSDTKMKEALGEYYNIFSEIKNINSKTGIQASLPYYLGFNL